MLTDSQEASQVIQRDDSSSSVNSQHYNPPSSDSSLYFFVKKAADKAIGRLVSKSKTLPLIKEELRSYYDNDSKNVLEIYKATMKQLEIMIKEDIDMVFESSNLQELLSQFDAIKQQNSTGSQKWRPSGNPTEDLQAHLHETSELELQHLEKLYSALVMKNKWLNEAVQQKSSKVSSLMNALEDATLKWKRAASIVDKTSQDDMIKIVQNFSSIRFQEEIDYSL